MLLQDFKNELNSIFSTNVKIVEKIDVKMNKELDNVESVDIGERLENLKEVLDTSMEYIDQKLEEVI